MDKVNVSYVDNMHSQWLRALAFYKTEIDVLKGILTEIAGKNTNAEVSKKVEHFENQFNIQSNNIDEIAHNINANITTIGNQANSAHAGYIDAQLLAEHTKLGADTDAEVKSMIDLIQSFRVFAAKWM